MNKYDLEIRTANFAKNLLKVLTRLRKTPYNYKIICQAIASGTSVSANYMEANGAESDKDFKHKIHLSLKESKEAKLWLELLMITNPESRDELLILYQEAKEFTLIFGKIVTTCSSKESK